jgi:small-conductance mechanosensitive channel
LFWNYTILNNTIREWAIAAGIICASILLIKLFRWLLIKKLKKIFERTRSTFDDFILQQVQSSVIPFLYLLSIYLGSQFLEITDKGHAIIRTALLIIIVYFVLRIVNASITYLFNSFHGKNQDRETTKASRGIVLIIRFATWIVGILFLVDNFGFDITTIIAGLGIGGIAIALASQTVLGDLFNYLAIFFDKPFEPGDFIVLDDKMGTVEYIGIRTTRIRTLSGEQLVCSNTDLTSARVHNFKRMEERRVILNFGVVYQTPPAVIKKIPSWMRNIIDSSNGTRFDRAHFRSFGDFSLNFEVAYYILSSDYNEYMDKQQNINLKILELFEEEKIEFAFPTQTILFDKETKATNKEASHPRQNVKMST